MAATWYKLTITDHDYHYTRYITWVQGTSKPQAIAKGAALIGAEKAVREHERMHRPPFTGDALLTEPEVKLEKVDLDEFWDKRDTVEVSDDS